MDSTENPLTGSPPPEVPLANAPLIRVIAQVRFPLIASVENRSFVAPFQEATTRRCGRRRARTSLSAQRVRRACSPACRGGSAMRLRLGE